MGLSKTQKNKDLQNAYMREWRHKNLEHMRQYQKAYYRDNKEKFQILSRKSRLKNNYGLTEQDYQQLLEKQGNQCALCPRTAQTRPLNIDHDHITGKVRGLLCPPCNRALGVLGDSIEGLQQAIDYINGVK